MKTNSITTLSIKRIVITLLILVMIPFGARFINIYLQQYDISLMFTMNVGGSIMIMYNWNLFSLHYNRAKHDMIDTIFYTIVAFLLIAIWTWFSLSFLNCRIILPSSDVLERYGYALPGMLVAYSFMEASVFCISAKCATDHFNIHQRELQTILATGILFGALITLLFLPSPNIMIIITTLLYNVVLMTLEAYSYNQTHSFIPGLLGFAFTNLLFMMTGIL